MLPVCLETRVKAGNFGHRFGHTFANSGNPDETARRIWIFTVF